MGERAGRAGADRGLDDFHLSGCVGGKRKEHTWELARRAPVKTQGTVPAERFQVQGPLQCCSYTTLHLGIGCTMRGMTSEVRGVDKKVLALSSAHLGSGVTGQVIQLMLSP